jgi:hypothetical protein
MLKRKLSKFSLIALIASIHAAISFQLFPWANMSFQQWFDTGAARSAVEVVGYDVGLIMSFPLAFRTMTSHPARISGPEFNLLVVSK